MEDGAKDRCGNGKPLQEKFTDNEKEDSGVILKRCQCRGDVSPEGSTSAMTDNDRIRALFNTLTPAAMGQFILLFEAALKGQSLLSSCQDSLGKATR